MSAATGAILRILAAGPGVTLQDAGRTGWLRFGVTEAGPMDRLAMATANRAVGNEAGATAIEISLGGIEVTAEGAAIPIALAGGRFDIGVDALKLPPAARVMLAPGASLKVRAGEAGAWCYLAVGGRFAIEPMLGSTATHTRSCLGGIAGRALAAGDALGVEDLAPVTAPATAPAMLDCPALAADPAPIRVVLGPQDDYFDPGQIARFCGETWTVSHRSDRMAYFLDGAAIVPANGLSIVSDGIVMGAIQVLGDGRPMVLMADRQVTGGYPKIATVIGADQGRVAQLRPGASVRFAATSIAEAVAARRSVQALMARTPATVPLGGNGVRAERLFASNLISGVTGGDAE